MNKKLCRYWRIQHVPCFYRRSFWQSV